MSTGTHTQQPSSFLRRYLESPRAQRRALGIGLAIFVVGAAAIVFAFFRNTGHPLPDKISSQPAQLLPSQKTVPVSSEAVAVMKKFIVTAVERKNLDEAYAIVGPDLRGGLTKAEFAKGNIPVIPYPAGDVSNLQYTIDYSHPTEASLEIGLNPDDTHPGTNRLTFYVGLKKIGGHWVVNYWSPRYHPPVPVSPN